MEGLQQRGALVGGQSGGVTAEGGFSWGSEWREEGASVGVTAEGGSSRVLSRKFLFGGKP